MNGFDWNGTEEVHSQLPVNKDSVTVTSAEEQGLCNPDYENPPSPFLNSVSQKVIFIKK